MPISIGGFGVREGSYVVLLGGASIAASDATLISVLSVATLLVASLPGAFLIMRGNVGGGAGMSAAGGDHHGRRRGADDLDHGPGAAAAAVDSLRAGLARGLAASASSGRRCSACSPRRSRISASPPTGFSLGIFIGFLGLVCLQLSISLSGLHRAVQDLAEHAALVEARVRALEAERDERRGAGAAGGAL